MASSTPSLSSAAATACAAGSWVLSISVATYTSGPFLAASIVGWYAIHVLTTQLFIRVHGDTKIDGYPAWSFMTSFLHGGVILPTLFFLCLWILPDRLWTPEEFFALSWEAGTFMDPLKQVHAAILAYMLKDFHLYETVEIGYAVHHVIATFGCTTCLLMPMAAGLNAFNAIQSETASALFSAYTVWPSFPTRIIYYSTMSLSNAVGGYLAYVLCGYDLSLVYRMIYAVAAVLLVLLRQGAVYLDLRKILSHENVANDAVKHAPHLESNTAYATVKPSSNLKSGEKADSSRSRSPRTKARAHPTHPPGLGYTPKKYAGATSNSSPAYAPYPPGLGFTPTSQDRAAKSPLRGARSPSRAVAQLVQNGLNGREWRGTITSRRKSHAPRRYELL